MLGQLNRHVLDHEMFEALAHGQGGGSAGRLLAGAERSKHLLLIKAVSDGARGPQRPLVRRAYRTLADLQKVAPDAVDAVLRHPAVGAWALDTLRRLRDGQDADAGRLAAVAAAAAIRAREPYAGPVPVDAGIVSLPSLGRVRLDPRETDCGIRVTADGAEVSGRRSRVVIPRDDGRRDVDGWEGLRRITATAEGRRLSLLIDDIDPFRFVHGPPAADRLDDADVEHWEAMVRDAWRLLCEHHHQVSEEVEEIVLTLTPLSYQETDQRSATSRECFGCVAASRPANGVLLALTLAHEVQHAKLTALLDLVHLLDRDRSTGRTLYYAPWREDPRPLGSLLHGAYAHLGVAAFWGRQRHLGGGQESLAAHAEFVRWRDATDAVVRVITDSGRLTPLGARFLAGMREELETWRDEQVPKAAVEMARYAARAHWQRRPTSDGSPR
jgi:HEXXH motif-containing protein